MACSENSSKCKPLFDLKRWAGQELMRTEQEKSASIITTPCYLGSRQQKQQSSQHVTKFDLTAFVSDPTIAGLDKLKKSDLWEIAQYYEVPVSSSLAKADLKAVVLDSLLNKGVLSLPAVAELSSGCITGLWPLCFSDNTAKCKDNQPGTAAGGLPNNDLGTPESGPKQVSLSQFGTQQRAFNKSWFEQFKWLEYSVTRNSCFSCRLYGRQNIRTNKDTLLSSTGFSNWKRALDTFREHEKSALHMSSMTCWQSFKSTQSHGDVIEQLNTASVAEITERRQYLKRIEGVTTFLGKQAVHNKMGLQGEVCQCCLERPYCHSGMSLNTAMAKGILAKLCKPKTIYLLVMFAKLLSITEGLHRYLQGESLDLGRAAQYKMATVQTLTDLRTDAGAEDVYTKAMTVREENHIQLPVGPRQKQKRLDWFVVESACGSTSNPATSDDFRHQRFYPCLDRIIQELSHRFSDVGEELMSGIQACNPNTSTFLSEGALPCIIRFS
ncbi:uncharacterized protein V6R79_024870 [Siganus canaliculatus]